jgi:hypothetical protein
MADAPKTQPERDFEKAMYQVYDRVGAETGYWAHRFRQMIPRRGGVGTAKYLLAKKGISGAFNAIWKAHKLELLVEAQVLQPDFKDLFKGAELAEARRRLKEHGYQPPS